MVAKKARAAAAAAEEDSDRSDGDERYQDMNKLNEVRAELEKTLKPSPYFENTKLTKAIKFSDDGVLKSVGMRILWKQGRGSLGERKNNASGNKRPLPWQSFFNWFDDPMVDMNQETVAKIIKEDVWPNPTENLNNAEDEYEYMMILKTTRTRKRIMMVAEETWPEFNYPLSSTLRCMITLNLPKYPYPPFCFSLFSSKFQHFLCFMKSMLLERLVHHCDLCGGSETSSYNSIRFQHFLCFMKSILSERLARHCNLCGGGSETSSYNSIKFQHFFCFMKSMLSERLTYHCNLCGGSEMSYNSIKFQHFFCFMKSMRLERLAHHCNLCGGTETSSYTSIKLRRFFCLMKLMLLERFVHHWSQTVSLLPL